MSKTRVETYRVRFPIESSEELRYTIVEINRILSLIEDRLDKIEATRSGGVFVTSQQERKFTE